MMELSDDLLCLFNAEVKDRGGSSVVEIPANELDLGTVQSGTQYRVAILSAGGDSGNSGGRGRSETHRSSGQEPPVSEEDTVEVEIEDVGEQGDGIARIGPGYVVFVPGTGIGDRVTIEIADARENFAFGDVVEGPY